MSSFRFFQPVVMLHGGEVAGMEVLARWLHPALGIVPPGAFIATAEREGLIGELAAMLMGKSVTHVEIKQPVMEKQPDGAFLASYLPAFDEVGEVVGISVAVVEITDSKASRSGTTGERRSLPPHGGVEPAYPLGS
jgi:hypothetical protein